ncbi:hypothetical protein HPP92_007795 [Vanilla planifolia]|uniref:Pyrroline-5-carboxylate reductase catalytic N-terminal domain-containing protein n=1 Tax=Vanilla planifolia TaxID=51239 RepID=A0A835RRV9_VANPL|nr:hypothetical protein HPP92_007795 [Vanilla planifolia]
MEGEEPPLKIAIIGFGNFGKFIAKGLQRQGHVVLPLQGLQNGRDVMQEEHDRHAAGSQFITHTIGRWWRGFLFVDGSSERRRMEDPQGFSSIIPSSSRGHDGSVLPFAAPGEPASDPKSSARGFGEAKGCIYPFFFFSS